MFLADAWRWLKGKVRSMLPKPSVEKELGVRIAESEVMQRAIELWMDMYKDTPYWKGGEKDVKTLNLPAAISAEFARLILTEFNMEVSGSAMADFVEKQMKAGLKERFRHVSVYAALGGIVAKVYPTNVGDDGKPTAVGVEWINADRFYPAVFDSSGNVTASVFVQYKTIGDDIYTRLEYHELKNRHYTVINKAYVAKNPSLSGMDNVPLETLLQREVSLDTVDEWSGLQPRTEIENLEVPLFVYIKVPMPNTVEVESPLGASVYSLAEEQIQAADEQYGRVLWEYEATEAAVDADETLFDLDANNNPIFPKGRERLFRLYHGSMHDDKLFLPYLPEIRDTSLFNGLNEHLYTIEWLCGLAYGTLSHAKEVEKTATEIKMSKQRSFNSVSLMQSEWNEGLGQLAKAIEEMALLYGMCPAGNVETTFTFGDGVLEDTDVEYQRRWSMVLSNKLRPELFLAWYFGCSEEEALEMMPAPQQDADSLYGEE